MERAHAREGLREIRTHHPQRTNTIQYDMIRAALMDTSGLGSHLGKHLGQGRPGETGKAST